MMNVDLASALCAAMLALTAAAAAAFFHMHAGRTRNRQSLNARHIWLCTICTHIYVNTKDEKISVCPRCGSYNSRDSGAVRSEKS